MLLPKLEGGYSNGHNQPLLQSTMSSGYGYGYPNQQQGQMLQYMVHNSTVGILFNLSCKKN